MNLHRHATLLALTAVIVGAASPALGVFVVDITQDGTDVVATSSGTINLSALSWLGYFPGVMPSLEADAEVAVGDTDVADFYSGTVTGPSSIGPGTASFGAVSSAGDFVGFTFTHGVLATYAGYASGSPLSGTATFAAQTFTSMGLSTGTYTWTWGSGVTADSFTVNVIPAVPASTQATRTLVVLGIALSGAVALRRRIAPNRE